MTRCATCNHELEARSATEKAESGIDDDWTHLVPWSRFGAGREGIAFGTLADHETIPVEDSAPAHAG